MYFLINLHRNELTAHKSNGAAARAALSSIGEDVPVSDCPVKTLFKLPDYDSRFKILTLSDALAIIDGNLSCGMNDGARSFVNQIQSAIDAYYQKKK